jgi:hypothetical protein
VDLNIWDVSLQVTLLASARARRRQMLRFLQTTTQQQPFPYGDVQEVGEDDIDWSKESGGSSWELYSSSMKTEGEG